jgi:hypothetical protein
MSFRPLEAGPSACRCIDAEGCFGARKKLGAMIGSRSSPLPLRFAVACRAGGAQAWQRRCVAELFSGGSAVWVALIELGADAPECPPRPPLFDPASQRRASLDAGDGNPVTVAGADVGKLAGLDLDAVLCFDDAAAMELAAVARRGAWHFRFGRAGRECEPPGFWECYDGDPVVENALLQRTGDGSDVVLRAGATSVSRTSLETSTDRALYESSSWPALACRAIAAGAALDGTPARATRAASAPRANALFAAILVLKFLFARLTRAFDVLFADKWNVGIAHAPIERFLQGGEWPRVDWLAEPDGLDYRADPFGTIVDGRAWALVERFDSRSARGRIEALALSADGWSSPASDAMTADAHMSYPFTLNHGGSAYCIPETLGQNAISLYRAVAMPDRWEKAASLLEGFDAVDATVVLYQQRWWLFCTDFREPRHHRLYAFFADELAGPYVAHAANPVKIDPRSAGCAGTPFVVDGKLYRPAQDCSRSYGGAVVLNRIVELTPLVFREEAVATVTPCKDYPAGVHTLSSLGAMTLVDGKRRAFTMRRIRWRLVRALRGFQHAGE